MIRRETVHRRVHLTKVQTLALCNSLHVHVDVLYVSAIQQTRVFIRAHFHFLLCASVGVCGGCSCKCVCVWVCVCVCVCVCGCVWMCSSHRQYMRVLQEEADRLSEKRLLRLRGECYIQFQ